MTTAPGRRQGGAGASARQAAAAERTAERIRQHRLAKVTLPVTAAVAAGFGYAAASVTVWEAGVAVALGVAAYGLRRTYRRAGNSWAKGAAGEVATARLLAPLTRRGYAVLHDRAVPGSRANLDHLVIGPCGVVYVDTKNWTSQRSVITLRGGELFYGRYPQTKALDTVRWEAGQAARMLGCPVRPVVAVHGARVPGRRIEIGDVTIVEAKRVRRLLQNIPPVAGWEQDRVAAAARIAEQQLPPYTG
jgi:Nuclease-related domain